MDEEEGKGTPSPVEPTTTDSAASTPPSTPAASVEPAASTPAAEPRRGPGRPKGSGKKAKKGKKSKPVAKPAKHSKVERADDDEGDDDEGDDEAPPRAELARVEPSTPVERDPSLPETPEERATRYEEMRRRVLRHAPTWERRADALGASAAVDLLLVVASGERGFAEPDAFTVALPTSGGARQVKTSGGGAVVRAIAQIIAAYAPENASDVIAHPLADAFAALGQVAGAIVVARLAPVLQGLLKGTQEDGTASADSANAPPVAA